MHSKKYQLHIAKIKDLKAPSEVSLLVARAHPLKKPQKSQKLQKSQKSQKSESASTLQGSSEMFIISEPQQRPWNVQHLRIVEVEEEEMVESDFSE